MSMKPNQYTKFKLSQPWGYFPPDVDKTIDEYEKIIGQLNQKLAEQMQRNTRLQDRIKSLEGELRAMHIEMSSIELPDSEETAETVVLQEFKDFHNGTTPPHFESEESDEGMVQIVVGDEDVQFREQTDAAMIGGYEEDHDVAMRPPTAQQVQSDGYGYGGFQGSGLNPEDKVAFNFGEDDEEEGAVSYQSDEPSVHKSGGIRLADKAQGAQSQLRLKKKSNHSDEEGNNSDFEIVT